MAECSKGFKTFVLSIFEWPLKTGFTVVRSSVLLLLKMLQNNQLKAIYIL